jgi:hypothetical protein
MNVWKLISFGLAGGLVASVVVPAAFASTNPARPPGLAGSCFDQPNIAHAKQSIEETIEFLAKAEHNHDGWRDRALAAANKARNEITGGCATGYAK